jgi:hypothetical protein
MGQQQERLMCATCGTPILDDNFTLESTELEDERGIARHYDPLTCIQQLLHEIEWIRAVLGKEITMQAFDQPEATQ